MKQRIGVLGSGSVAQALAKGFLKHGYPVTVGTGHPDKLAQWKASAGKGAVVGTFSEAAKAGEVIVVAIKGSAAKEALDSAGLENLRGKTVIDTSNPIADAPPESNVLHFFTTLEDSLMERLQREFPEANFVKAFNSVGSTLMVDPNLGGAKPTMFICGNSDAAKQDVTAILDEFGWETEDMGTCQAARAIEPLCLLWCVQLFKSGSGNHAFKLLKG